MRVSKILLVSVVVLAGIYCSAIRTVQASDWPQFLGPHRNGLSDETGLIDKWPDAGLKEVFRVRGGIGMSGLCIQQGRLLTLAQNATHQQLLCLDAKTGKQNWVSDLAPAYSNPMGNGPRSAPALTDSQAFVLTGEGNLIAVGLAEGDIQWRVNVIEELGGKAAEYGMACSPLIHDGLVIVTAGSPNGTVAAYESKTGKLGWSVGQDRTGYSSPALLKVAGETHLVVFSGTALLGIEPSEGELLWRFPYETDYDCNIATPIQVGSDVFVSSGENHGSVMLSVTKEGGAYQVEERWSSQGRKSVMRNEWQTSILLKGHLYGFDNVGSAGPITHLTCIDAKSGERVWQELRFGKGNLIAADGKLLMTTMDGEFVMVRATDQGFQEIGRQEVLGMTRQAPALSNGFVYLRDDQEIVCIDLRNE